MLLLLYRCRFCNNNLLTAQESYKHVYCNQECFKNYWRKIHRDYGRYKYQLQREQILEKNRQWRLRNPGYMKLYVQRFGGKYREIRKFYVARLKQKDPNYFNKYLIKCRQKDPDYFKKYRFSNENSRYYGITLEQYKELTSHCNIKGCEFTETVDLHHIDKNKNNNEISNLIGLCPNHHQLIHRHHHQLMPFSGEWILVKESKKFLDNPTENQEILQISD